MSPAAARALTSGTSFRYCGIRYQLAEVYTTPAGKVFLVPVSADARAQSASMFPADQCDPDRRPAPVRTPAKRKDSLDEKA